MERLIHVTPEGGKLRPGLNFYPWSDTGSFGVKLLTKRYMRAIRYRKKFGDIVTWKVDRSKIVSEQEAFAQTTPNPWVAEKKVIDEIFK